MLFSDIKKAKAKKAELYQKAHELSIQEEALTAEYHRSIVTLLESRPELTARQIGRILAKDADEQESISHSVASLSAYRPSHHKKSLPQLKNRTTGKTHRYAELDEKGNYIGHSWTEHIVETVYYIED